MNFLEQYTPEQLETQYNLRLARPDYEAVIVPDWIKRSEAARASLNCLLDTRYGSGPKQKLDVFRSADRDAPALVYFHGGYWQRGDKSVYSFLAEPFVRHGITVIIAGYDLCPAVTITELVEQTRQAVEWVWRHAGDIGISRDRITVMGHSAGGHITAMLMGTDWAARASDLPTDLLHAGVQISPLNDLAPLRYTSLNDAVQITETEAVGQSPMNNPPVSDAAQIVACGGRETAEFHRQSDMYVEAFATPERSLTRYSVPECDHFDELNVLATEGSPFFEMCRKLVKS